MKKICYCLYGLFHVKQQLTDFLFLTFDCLCLLRQRIPYTTILSNSVGISVKNLIGSIQNYFVIVVSELTTSHTYYFTHL